MSNIRAYSLLFAGFFAGGATGSAVVANALPGDVIYEAPAAITECLNSTTSSCIAQCVKTAGVWSGALADVNRLVMRRVKAAECSSTIKVNIKGYQKAQADAVPVGSTIHGIVE